METWDTPRGSGRAGRGRRPGVALAAALLALATGCPGPRTTVFQDLALPPEGLTFLVDGVSMTMLPAGGIEEMELEYRASGQLQLTYGTTESPEGMKDPQIPWRYLPLPPGPGTVRLDLRTTPGWSPSRKPFLRLAGTGELTLTRGRARPVPRGTAELKDGVDHAWRWAPVSLGHGTINLLDPPYWKVSEQKLLFGGLGWIFVALATAGAATLALVRRRWWPGPAVALAAVAVVGLGDGIFWARMLPPLDLRPTVDVEERIRDHYRFDPEVGPLAALARATLPPGDRVGIMVPAGAWFPWETLCFNLAPRRCVVLQAGAEDHAGLQGVDRLSLRDLDAIVTFHAGEPLPPGFAPVATLNRNALVARRR
jgi:hypothetical protein